MARKELENLPKTSPERIKILFKKYRGALRKRLELAELIEPIVLLLRRNQSVEFYEDAKSGEWEFKHSDGSSRLARLEPTYIHTFDYGKKQFKGYIFHEDWAFPIPPKPLVEGNLLQIILDKVMHDIKTWKAKEMDSFGKMLLNVGIGAGIVILAFAVFQMLKPQVQPQQIIQVINQSKDLVLATAVK